MPTIPGSAAASVDPQQVLREVQRIGLPVLLKAAAGGGGKGGRVVAGSAAAGAAADTSEGVRAKAGRSGTSADEQITSAMREAASSFGDPSLLVERYLPGGRHIEVQILGDGRGNVLHLWDRECSLQRRHQKVVEEAPALLLPSGLRERILASAVALGRQVSYRALGTGLIDRLLATRGGMHGQGANGQADDRQGRDRQVSDRQAQGQLEWPAFAASIAAGFVFDVARFLMPRTRSRQSTFRPGLAPPDRPNLCVNRRQSLVFGQLTTCPGTSHQFACVVPGLDAMELQAFLDQIVRRLIPDSHCCLVTNTLNHREPLQGTVTPGCAPAAQ